MPTLRVIQMLKCDVYTDTARVNEKDRIDKSDNRIPEGRVCNVSANRKHRLLSLRGDQESSGTVRLDDISRGSSGLDLQEGESYDFEFRQVWWLGQVLWAWRASHPAYRISARVGVLSAVLGMMGLILGLIGLCISLQN
jgi:hypothetical protein